MSIFLIFIVLLIILAIFVKIKERNALKKVIHTKTGKQIPYYTTFQDICNMFERFSGGNVFDTTRNQFIKKGNVDTFGTFFFGNFMIVTRNPSDIKNVLSTKHYSKKEGTLFGLMFNRYLGDSLLFLNGDKWATQRKAINSAMSYAKIKQFIPIFNKMAGILIDKVKESKEEMIDIHEELTLMTFDVIGKAGFGFDFKSLSGSKNKELTNIKKVLGSFTDFFSMLLGSFYDSLPTKRNKDLKDTSEQVDKWINEIIQERRKKKTEDRNDEIDNDEKEKRAVDLLDLIIEAEREENVSLTSKDLHNNIFLFFFAGHDTSSSALTSVLYFLAKNQEYIDKAREEVVSVLEGRIPSFEDLQNLPIINAIIKETIRLFPPAPVINFRVTEEDVEIDGYSVPKGTMVYCPTFMCHFDEKYWEKPHDFNPQRFLDKQSKEAQGNAYFPFSNGPRRCPGDKFATAEITVTLVRLLQNFKRWELKEGWKYVHDGKNFTTRPIDGLPIKFFV